jgi:hypothetical protein
MHFGWKFCCLENKRMKSCPNTLIIQGQHHCRGTWPLGHDGGCILQNEAWLLQVAVANRPDSLLWGHKWGLGRQWLPQDQGSHTQVQGPMDTWATPDEDAAADAATPATPPHGGAAAAAGRVEPQQAPSTASSTTPSPGGKGKRAAGGGRKNARS